MTDSSPQPEPQSDVVTLDTIWKLLSSQSVRKGVPGILLGIAITQASQSNWNRAAKFTGGALLVWLLSFVVSAQGV